eukprot:TRINITY_DN4176_c1_g1_i1.p1 TRINITY_DN4176_c1_g1~~TRINITY_DN4176_c1_g1_i1.p1  ORF type:complete len:679 (-),score=265.27 TRINITY_DN4176_c1_g1_i1:20-2056(-)
MYSFDQNEDGNAKEEDGQHSTLSVESNGSRNNNLNPSVQLNGMRGVSMPNHQQNRPSSIQHPQHNGVAFVNHSLPHISLPPLNNHSSFPSNLQVYGNLDNSSSSSHYNDNIPTFQFYQGGYATHQNNNNNNSIQLPSSSSSQFGIADYVPERERKRNLTTDDQRSRSVSPKRDASSSPSGHAKRGWESWSLEEMDAFFSSLQRDGRDFEKITSNVRTKNYDQVRYFYYRILNKIIKLLKPNKIDKKDPKEVMNALFAFWELKKAAKNKDEEYTPAFASALKERIAMTSQSMTVIAEDDLDSDDRRGENRRGRKKSIDEAPRGRSLSANSTYSTHLSAGNIPTINTILVQDNYGYSVNNQSIYLHPTQHINNRSSINSNDIVIDRTPPRTSNNPGIMVNSVQFSTTGLSPNRTSSIPAKPENQVAEKITVQLVPRNGEVASILSSYQQNPRLQLTMKGTKTIGFLTDFLVQKWVIRSDEGSTIPLTNGDIIFHPRMSPDHPGWSAKESPSTTLSTLANMQSILKLEYCWSPFLYSSSVQIRSPSGSLTGSSPSSMKPNLSALENYSSLNSAIHSPTMQGNFAVSPNHSPNPMQPELYFESSDLYTPDHPSKQSPYYNMSPKYNTESPAHDIIYARQVQDSFAAAIQDLNNPLDDQDGAFDLSGSNNDLSYILKSEKFFE